MSNVILADLQYFPPVSFYFTSFQETNVDFILYDRYRKMTFANRCLIAGANNIIGLSIPLDGGRQQNGSIKEIRVSGSESWQKRHWRSLHSAYNRSAFFEHYAGELEEMFRRPVHWLADWNRLCMEWVKAKTGWPPEIHFLDTKNLLENTNQKSAGLQTDWRNQLLPKNYLSFPAPLYHQVFGDINGFQANLSVLDLLFNTGPGAREILGGGPRPGSNR